MKLLASMGIDVRRQLIMVTQRRNSIAWLGSYNVQEIQEDVIVLMLIFTSTKGTYKRMYLNVLRMEGNKCGRMIY